MTTARTTPGLLVALALAGCVTRVPFAHGPLAPPPVTRSGVVMVRSFTDRRPHDHADIGTLRNLFGMPVVHVVSAAPGRLAVQLTACWRDALRNVGYHLVDPPAAGTGDASPDVPVLDGDIEEFWMDTWFALWHTVVVRVRLGGPGGGPPSWEHTFEAHDCRPLWLGAPGEYSACIGAALDAALAEAVREFAGEAFADAVRRSGRGGRGADGQPTSSGGGALPP